MYGFDYLIIDCIITSNIRKEDNECNKLIYNIVVQNIEKRKRFKNKSSSNSNTYKECMRTIKQRVQVLNIEFMKR